MKFFFLVSTVFFSIAFPSVSNALATRNHSGKYAAVVVEQGTNTVLYARRANLQRYPASLTKIMTLYLVFEDLRAKKIRMSTLFTVSKHASRQPPSKLGLHAGQKISVRNAILALIVKSANDVAVVVAENISGSEALFAKRMTSTAKRLGMKKTVFKNASGLPNYAQVTTAYDMAALGIRIYEDFPEYYHLFKTKYFTYNKIKLKNHNRLLFSSNDVDGIKTGYIHLSGYNLVASAQRNGKRVFGVIFGGVSWMRRNAHMMYLLNKGFRTIDHMVQRPLDKTLTKPYILAQKKNTIRPPIKTVKSNNSVVEQGSALPQEKQWSVQVGAYSRISIAKSTIQRVLSLLPDKADVVSEISEVKKRNQSLYRARISTLEKKQASELCQTVKGELSLPCMVLYP